MLPECDGVNRELGGSQQHTNHQYVRVHILVAIKSGLLYRHAIPLRHHYRYSDGHFVPKHTQPGPLPLVVNLILPQRVCFENETDKMLVAGCAQKAGRKCVCENVMTLQPAATPPPNLGVLQNKYFTQTFLG